MDIFTVIPVICFGYQVRLFLSAFQTFPLTFNFLIFVYVIDCAFYSVLLLSLTAMKIYLLLVNLDTF